MKGWDSVERISLMKRIDLYSTSNYEKCEAIKKLGYRVKESGKGYIITSDKIKNLDYYINVYFNSINEILFAFKKDLEVLGYKITATVA